MSGFETIAAVAALNAAGAALGAAQAGQSASQQMRTAQGATQQRFQEIAQAQAIEERRRQEQLRREQAQRLARFGARGIGGDSGSAAAVQAGLAAESARRGAEETGRRQLAMSHSLLDLADRNRAALLSAAQARENAVLGIGKSIAGALHSAEGKSARGGVTAPVDHGRP